MTRAASVQFISPIFFRLIKIRTEIHTYDGWLWIDGYQLDAKGEAAARRELFVMRAGVSVMNSPPTPEPRTAARRTSATR
ncbi:hypothetical protein [Micromonospora sp. RTGN7]|uniref:hypothetical protein n=1 Tax=Micromonospora sp. RTGN7 TaxID=3016526 RepID=UPI0039B6F6BF